MTKRLSIVVLLIAAFLISGYAVASGQGVVILAKKIQGEITLEPDSPVWNDSPKVEIPLFSQVMAKPRIYDSKIKNVMVRAVHNSKEIAFLLEWNDDTPNNGLDINRFPDALAAEFPSAIATGKPHFGMGDKENPANIWYWKSAWQAGSVHPKTAVLKEYSPNLETDEKTHLFIDRAWQSGVLAGNPVSNPLTAPVENLVSVGFSTLTDNGSSSALLEGRGEWKDGKWRVVLKRSLKSDNKYDVVFSEGKVTPVAFAVWNGAERQRGARKVVSTWYYVALETEERITTYLLPIVALLVAGALEYWIINIIRRKRGA